LKIPNIPFLIKGGLFPCGDALFINGISAFFTSLRTDVAFCLHRNGAKGSTFLNASFKVISGKEYTAKVSKASSFCSVPVNGNGIFIFRNHLY